MNISHTNKLNWENAISLKKSSPSKNEQLKQIEEQAKEIIKLTLLPRLKEAP